MNPSRLSPFRTANLLASLSLAGAVACSGATNSEPDDPVPTSPASGEGTPNEPVAPIAPVVASNLATALVAAGIDPRDPPTWDALKQRWRDKEQAEGKDARRAATKAVMELFAKSLGIECKTCHSGADRAVPLERQRVVRGMWNHFVVGLRQKDGSALFCDSCHQGKTKFLLRDDSRALAGWMRANFVGKLARADGAEHTCTTCHGSPFEGTFLEGWKARD